MQEPFTQSLEQVMKNTDAYQFVLTIPLLLVALIVQAIQLLGIRGERHERGESHPWNLISSHHYV
jgi:hypothetical protein